MIKNNKKIIIRIILSLFLILIVLYYFKSKIIREVIGILLVSFILSYALKPIYKYLVEKTNLNKRILAGLLIFSVVAVCVSIVAFLIPLLFNEGLNLDGIFKIGEDIASWINQNISSNKYEIFNSLGQEVSSKLNIFIVEISKSILQTIISFTQNIISLAVIPIVTYYFLADNSIITSKFYLLFPISKRKLIKKIANDIDKVLGKFILSQFFLCGVIGILTFVILIILDVNYPLWLAILNAVVNIIPYFGPIFGAIPAVIVALIGSPSKALYTAIAFFIIQQIEGNILAPLITSNSIRIHPLIIIILLMIGEKMGGFIGMILAVPVGVIIKVIYEDLNYNTL